MSQTAVLAGFAAVQNNPPVLRSVGECDSVSAATAVVSNRVSVCAGAGALVLGLSGGVVLANGLHFVEWELELSAWGDNRSRGLK